MVGPCGFEPQTSTVSKASGPARPVTQRVSVATEVLATTAKPQVLQVKLQVSNCVRWHASVGLAPQPIIFTHARDFSALRC